MFVIKYCKYTQHMIKIYYKNRAPRKDNKNSVIKIHPVIKVFQTI